MADDAFDADEACAASAVASAANDGLVTVAEEVADATVAAAARGWLAACRFAAAARFAACMSSSALRADSGFGLASTCARFGAGCVGLDDARGAALGATSRFA
ncbi:MAG: hypothetical protein WDN30_01530 [Pararobbsia sp.]